MNWDGKAISAYQLIENNTRVYLYLVPSALPQQVTALKDGALAEAASAEGQNACLVLKYPQRTRTLNLRYGISFIDETRARENMQREGENETMFNYRNLFNEETKFFHPKDGEGNFIEPFDYYKFSGGMGARGYYDENNAWIYRWDVQHNIPDLIDLMGGKDAFVNNLDAMFTEPLGRSKYAFYAQLPDHTGIVGHFSMANEPSLHVPYLYNYAGQPWKTQKRLRKLVFEMGARANKKWGAVV